MLERVRDQGKDRKWVVHGFRHSFKTFATEMVKYPKEIVELCLAHSIGNAIEAAYWQGDAIEKRRKLMNDWARWCMKEGDPGRDPEMSSNTPGSAIITKI
jgi:integrase